MQDFLQKIFFGVLIFCCTNLCAQVKFSATVTPNLIGKNDYTQLKLIIENGASVEKINPPDLGNFEILSGPNEESGMTAINGNVKKYFALNYILKPKTNGTFTILPTTAIVNGVSYKSNAVVLKVSIKATLSNNKNPSPFSSIDIFDEPIKKSGFDDYILKKGENITEKIKRNMFVKVDVTKTSCFVGEPIVVTYKLFTRLKSESNIIKNPSFNGFSVVDMEQPNALNYEIEKLNGKEYNVYTIRKTQLYPLQAGTFILEEAEVENNIQFIKEEYLKNNLQQFKNGFDENSLPAEAIEKYKISLKNNAINITVKPLPTNNQPLNFKGAVGNFNLEATLDKSTFSTDETAKLKLTLTGEGNLQLVNVPEIKWPKNTEVFTPIANEDINKSAVPISGTKTIEYSFVTDSVGTFKFDSISFVFFDTKTNSYKTIFSKPIFYTTVKGSGKKQFTNKQLIDNTEQTSNFFSNRKIIVGCICLIFLSTLFFWLKKDEQKIREAQRLEGAENEAMTAISQKIELSNKDWLAQSKSYMYTNDEQLFYKAIDSELNEFILYKTGIDKSILNKKSILDWLDENKVPLDVCNNYLQLKNELETKLYNPFAENIPMEDVYKRADEFIQYLRFV